MAALSTWKPLFLAVPPGQATGHRISSTVPARKTEAPLNGALLLDGQAKAWDERLKEKSDSYYGETNGPLILNYHEARQIRAEYASLECKAVAPNRGADFPNTVEEQRHLVAKLYDAIMNMENILEKKRPFALKKTINTEAKEAVASEKDALAEGSSTTITPARKRPASEMASDADDESSGQDNQSSDEDDEHDDSRSGPPSMETSPTAKVVEKPKETISVVKVKSLSRIEVEMLCWEILVSLSFFFFFFFLFFLFSSFFLFFKKKKHACYKVFGQLPMHHSTRSVTLTGANCRSCPGAAATGAGMPSLPRSKTALRPLPPPCAAPRQLSAACSSLTIWPVWQHTRAANTDARRTIGRRMLSGMRRSLSDVTPSARARYRWD